MISKAPFVIFYLYLKEMSRITENIQVLNQFLSQFTCSLFDSLAEAKKAEIAKPFI